jgi:hypothetical protein
MKAEKDLALGEAAVLAEVSGSRQGLDAPRGGVRSNAVRALMAQDNANRVARDAR